jgi:hypothetical protein
MGKGKGKGKGKGGTKGQGKGGTGAEEAQAEGDGNNESGVVGHTQQAGSSGDGGQQQENEKAKKSKVTLEDTLDLRGLVHACWQGINRGAQVGAKCGRAFKGEPAKLMPD